MAIAKEQKQEFAAKFGATDKDTGNTKVQVAILSYRISELTEHLRSNKKDHSTRLGLMKLVGKRRRLLRYLEHTQIEEYRQLIKDLGIRK